MACGSQWIDAVAGSDPLHGACATSEEWSEVALAHDPFASASTGSSLCEQQGRLEPR